MDPTPLLLPPNINKRPGDRCFKVNGCRVEYEAEATYPSNYVITSSYTWYNFIFKNLYEQFCNPANLYFLFIGLLQIIPQISTTGGNPTMYQPLAFIVLVSALRAASEDWGKHKADDARNSYTYDVLKESGWVATKSGDLAVGNIVKVKQDDMVPADMILIGSDLDKGHCFIDKANLNGETCLEVLSSIKETRKYKTDSQLQRLNCSIAYEPPNAKFDSFRGMMYLINADGGQTDITLDGKVLLMRETNLKNCPFIIGIVIYTGDETKIQQSNSDGGRRQNARMKRSQVMRRVDGYLRKMLAFQFLLCVIGAFGAGIWVYKHDGAWYLQLTDNAGFTGFLAFFSWFILLSQMVPISLIVSSEMVKFIQSGFIQWDEGLYHKPINKYAKCNNSTIHEELGLVNYIFSDKTGTLTQNKMQFRYVLLPSGEYGSKETEIARAVKTRRKELERRQQLGKDYHPEPPLPWTKQLSNLRDKEERAQKAKDLRSSFRGSIPGLEMGMPAPNEFTPAQRNALLKGLWGPPPTGITADEHKRNQAMLRRYMRHMALSNTVRPYEDQGEIKYQSESAEELAMVLFAQMLGFEKLQINPTVLLITEYNTELVEVRKSREVYRHLATLGFTSQRARVTVIYQRLSSGTSSFYQTSGIDSSSAKDATDLDFDQKNPIQVMTKGQDSVILPFFAQSQALTPKQEESLMLELQELSSNGLRTLVVAYSDHPVEWWEERQKEYVRVTGLDESEHSQGHSAGKCNQRLCEKCLCHNYFNKLEEDAKLLYLGCLGLEDQLQPLVPESVQDYLRAGIKVWMITGDKLETAKNIGLACNLIDADMEPSLSSGKSIQEVTQALQQSRLIVITGQWANLADNEEELAALFGMLDDNEDGKVSLDELETCLKTLNFAGADKVKQQFTTKEIDKAHFISMMKKFKVTLYDAVKYDIEMGIQTYTSIEDHVAYPVSLLVNRSAFQVMFGKNGDKKEEDHLGPSDAELEQLRENFFLLASVSKSVVFARAEPAMKKRMVTEIQKRVPEAVTLAIGDGANDTDMITAAHVGIGISGVEGTAATNSADYAIGSFYMLHTLLFVHGFWNYHRIAGLVYFIFYKACLLAVTGYFFGFFSGFSGQQFFNDPIYQMYNVVFTALPVLVVAILDQPLPREILEDEPSAFGEARGRAFRSRGFIGWIGRSLVHAVVIFFVPFWAENTDILDDSGQVHGLWYTSTVVYYCVVLVPTVLIGFNMVSITWIHVGSIVISIVTLFLFSYVASLMPVINPPLYGVIARMYAAPHFWFVMLVCVSIPTLLELLWRYVRLQLRPTFSQILQERLRKKMIDHQHSSVLLELSSPDASETEQTKPKAKPDSLLAGHIISDNNRLTDPVSSPPTTQGGSDLTLVTLAEYQGKWTERKLKTSLKPLHTAAHDTLRKLAEEKKETEETTTDSLRSSMVRTLLRFRNLTGSQFDSAAQAKYQQHDSYEKHGEKHEEHDEKERS